VAVAAQAIQILTMNRALIFEMKAYICGHIIKKLLTQILLYISGLSNIIFLQDD
jgi:hypothetical protein